MRGRDQDGRQRDDDVGTSNAIGSTPGKRSATSHAAGLRIVALQEALVDRPSVTEWGYRLAIGPASPGGAVVYRDAEWDPEDPPDEPDEAFVGFEIWDLQRAAITQRIPYVGPIPVGADIGADQDRIAVMMSDHVLEVSRGSSETRRLEALALDPFRLEIACVSGNELVVVRLGS